MAEEISTGAGQGAASATKSVYLATYSSVAVFELMVRGIACMRRRSDGYINATQILKIAGIEKAKRTKILEKEILTGEHEKVQGGYGKYQGTWYVTVFGFELLCNDLKLNVFPRSGFRSIELRSYLPLTMWLTFSSPCCTLILLQLLMYLSLAQDEDRTPMLLLQACTIDKDLVHSRQLQQRV